MMQTKFEYKVCLNMTVPQLNCFYLRSKSEFIFLIMFSAEAIQNQKLVKEGLVHNYCYYSFRQEGYSERWWSLTS